jgi:type IV pilus assembly protein PilB
MTDLDHTERMGTRVHAQDRVAYVLARTGVVADDHLEEARRASEGDDAVRGGLMFHLLDRGVLTPQQVAGPLEAEFGQQVAALPSEAPERSVLALISAGVAREIGAVPVARAGGTLQVAMRDPFDADALLRLRALTGMDVEPLLADEHSLWQFLLRCYSASDDLARTAGLAIEAVARDGGLLGKRGDAVHEQVREAAIPSFVRGILQDGRRAGASDIHFEPYAAHMRIRYRIDGRLQEVWSDGDPRMAAAIAGHIKYLANMRTATDRMPQDGSLSMEVDGRQVQFRVGTLPTVHGEKVVLRVLDASDVPADLAQLGMEARERGIVERAIRAKRGLVLVTGPTNSGKSTTLAAILTALESPEINIYTVEDPVERTIPGVNQVLVMPHDTDPQLDRSYLNVLRAFLRQDPNIIMVGEIRDAESGGITLKAALTGHFVLSTVHTNDAPGTITRLIDMKLERFSIAGALRAIIAQRLVRRVCPRCAESYLPDPAELVLAGFDPAAMDGKEFRRGSGRTPAGHRCTHCNGKGYRGRIGLFEVLEVTHEIRRAIAEGATEHDVLELARRDGMRTLCETAKMHALAGATTLAEVIEETGG